VLNQDIVPGDELIVVQDGGWSSEVQRLVDLVCVALPARLLTHGPTRDFGNSQREFAYRICKGDWIVHQDDDDIFTKDAFTKIRKALKQRAAMALGVCEAHIFKVVAPWREVVWTEPGEIEQGNCCTIQMVLPNPRICNCPATPQWPKRQGGNIPFLKAVAAQQGLVWRPEVIAICRPYEEDLWWENSHADL
jgi:hypothetical protein